MTDLPSMNQTVFPEPDGREAASISASFLEDKKGVVLAAPPLRIIGNHLAATTAGVR